MVTPEPLHADARALLDSDQVLMAPDLLLVEAATVVWKKQRRGDSPVIRAGGS